MDMFTIVEGCDEQQTGSNECTFTFCNDVWLILLNSIVVDMIPDLSVNLSKPIA